MSPMRLFVIAHAAARAALVALLAAVTPAVAQPLDVDGSQPIEIIADQMEWEQGERVAVARGNADAIQGKYRLRADVRTAYLGEVGSEEGDDGGDGGGDALGEIQRIDAEGNVFFSTPEETAEGRSGTYDVTKGVVVLTGGVVLTREDNVIRGERMVMDLNSGTSRVDAAPATEDGGGGRVRALFLPKSDSDEEENGDDAQ